MEAIDFSWLAQGAFMRALFDKYKEGFAQQFPGGTPEEVRLSLPPLSELEKSRDALAAAVRDFWIIKSMACLPCGEGVPLGEFIMGILSQVMELIALRYRIAAYFTSGALDQLFYERAGLKISKENLHAVEVTFASFSERAYNSFVASGCVRGAPLPELNEQAEVFKNFRLCATTFFERLEARPLGKALLSFPRVLEGDPLAGQIFAFFKSRNDLKR